MAEGGYYPSDYEKEFDEKFTLPKLDCLSIFDDENAARKVPLEPSDLENVDKKLLRQETETESEPPWASDMRQLAKEIMEKVKADISESDSSDPEDAYKITSEHRRVFEKEIYDLVDDLSLKLKKEERYKIRNDAKIRAAQSTRSYDEFKSIVDAAHLKPISAKDKSETKTKNRIWNVAAKETYD